MKTARTLFYLLLATNLVLGIVTLLPFAGINLPLRWANSDDAERMTHQLTPEKIRIEHPAIAVTAAASAPTGDMSSPAAAGSAPTGLVSASAPAPAPATAKCIAIKNLTVAQTQDLTRLGSGQEGLKVEISGVSPSSFWVIIPPNGGKDGAKRRIELLGKAGFDDRYIIHDAGPNQYAVSIGKFHNEEAAKRLVDALRAKNFKTAVITALDETGHGARAQISGRGEQPETLIRSFLADHKDAQRDECAK